MKRSPMTMIENPNPQNNKNDIAAAAEEEDMQPLLPYLPEHIIVEIRLRLPVKSLLRFRCVCKSWYNLVSDPQFVKTHLSIAASRSHGDDYTHHLRLILRSDPLLEPGPYKPLSLNSLLYEHGDNDDAIEVHDYSLKTWRCGTVVGSCNGLVCILVYDDEIATMFLWNPATRESKRLPDLDLWELRDIFGFGYDESNDDYKVVVILCDYDVPNDETGDVYQIGEMMTMVYSLKIGSWRRIIDFPPGIVSDSHGVFLNGVLHWGAENETGPVFTSLDLTSETYEEFVLPDFGDGDYCWAFGALRGWLYFWCDFKTHADVWVMKEYGVRESWTKLFAIPYVTIREDDYYCYRPLNISNDGEILLRSESCLFLYNSKDGTFKIRHLRLYFEQYVYVESLVSLNVDK